MARSGFGLHRSKFTEACSSGQTAMLPRRQFFILCVSLLTPGVLGEVWEFGVDAPGSIIVDHQEGKMTLFQKTKEINLETPPCFLMEYVRVQVDNSMSKPTVTYESMSKTVRISYKMLQYSVSSYTVIGKAARIRGCYLHNTDIEKPMSVEY